MPTPPPQVPAQLLLLRMKLEYLHSSVRSMNATAALCAALLPAFEISEQL
jgi:hypothetical protein